MRTRTCSSCNKENTPYNESIKVDGVVYCLDCANARFKSAEELKNHLVDREPDPTVCSSCQQDFGDTELKKISTHPICSTCEKAIQEKVFPVWVKGFFAGILVIVIFSIYWNWRFFSAYRNLKEVSVMSAKEDFTEASRLATLASNQVPEVEDLSTLAAYFRGIDLLKKDSSGAAWLQFNACKDKLPVSYNIQPLLLQSRIGYSFDIKDYKGFLEACNELLAQDSSSAYSWTSVASAHACLYADKGDEEELKNSLYCLQTARMIDDTSRDMKEYYNRIEYRLDSRKIITGKEFTKQFPNGWVKN